MHELAITQNIVDIAIGEAGDRRIMGINLVIGELSSVAEESIRFCFQAISQGTPAEGASLSLVRVPALIKCTHCANEFGVDRQGVCPRCGKIGGEVVQGREFYIESIEVED